MKFSFNETKGATEASARLTAGIRGAKFMGVDKGSVELKNGDSADVLSLKLNIDGYGEYTQNFFVPSEDSDTKRSEGMYGENPSRLEHFLIAVREILLAVAPKAVEALDNDKPVVLDDDEEVNLSDCSFAQLVKGLKKITAPHVGEEVQVKLLPQSNGFVSLPTFCARITKKGNVGIKTFFIGHDLVLSDSEKRTIDRAQNASPTNMASASNGDDELEELSKKMGLDTNDVDDLPFA